MAWEFLRGVETLGLGTDCSKGVVSGKKTTFKPEEKIYAGWVVHYTGKGMQRAIVFYRKENGSWVEKVRHEELTKYDKGKFWRCSWITRSDHPNNITDWKVEFQLNNQVFETLNFKIVLDWQFYDISGDPMGAEIWEGDKFLGTSGISLRLPYKDHYLTFKKEGYKDKTMHVGTKPGGEIINIRYTLEKELIPTPPEPPIPVIPEETIDFWTAKGYSFENAEKIAKWCIANKATPSPEMILEIIEEELDIGDIFRIRWEEVVKQAEAGNILEMSKALLALANTNITEGTDKKILAGSVPIGPAGAGTLFATATGWTKIGKISWATKLWSIAKFILTHYKSLLAVLALAYGISFGTSWFGKEGLIEQVSIPLSDLIRDMKYEVTQEKLDIAESYYKTYSENIETADKLISVVSWLWPPTRSEWIAYIETARLDLAEKRKLLDGFADELAGIVPPIDIPEVVRTYVRDIIDGDTIDVDQEIIMSDKRLPEYGTTGHARVRMVGINAPEKTPKGEILCTDIEVYEVEKKWADKSRDRLLPLNDKEVELFIDPEHRVDTHGRILARVDWRGVDIGLSQIKEGLACWYFREKNKYVDDEVYKAASIKAKEDGVGMWEILPEQPGIPEEEKITFSIDSIPSNAPVFIDGVATHHNTPTDEIEQKDVFHLWTEGEHVLKIIKSGMEKEVTINLVKGERLELVVDLTAMPPPEEPPEKPPEEPAPPEEPPEVPPEEEDKDKIIADLQAQIATLNAQIADLLKQIEDLIGAPPAPPEEPAPPAPPVPTLPSVYTPEQEWALTEAFSQIWDLTKGAAQLSKAEYETLVDSFAMYSADQKKVLDPLFADVWDLTKGAAQLSKAEFDQLKIKYRIS